MKLLLVSILVAQPTCCSNRWGADILVLLYGPLICSCCKWCKYENHCSSSIFRIQFFIAMAFYTPSYFMNLKSFHMYLTSYIYAAHIHYTPIIVSVMHYCFGIIFTQHRDVFCVRQVSNNFWFYDPWNGNWLVLNWLILVFIVPSASYFFSILALLYKCLQFFMAIYFRTEWNSSKEFQLQSSNNNKKTKLQRKEQICSYCYANW